MASHKIFCINCVQHLDAFQNITYTMEWIYMLALHASDVMLAIIATGFIMASMLLTCVAGRYYGIHRNFCVYRDPMLALDGRS